MTTPITTTESPPESDRGVSATGSELRLMSSEQGVSP
jgi:hypothetical protein